MADADKGVLLAHGALVQLDRAQQVRQRLLGVFLLLQLLLVLTWELVFAWAEVHEPWFLNSGKALVSSCAFIFICTVVILLARRRSSIADVLALTAGTFVYVGATEVVGEEFETPYRSVRLRRAAALGAGVVVILVLGRYAERMESLVH